MKIEGSGSISKRHGSTDPDPDPHQNAMDPQLDEREGDDVLEGTLGQEGGGAFQEPGVAEGEDVRGKRDVRGDF